MDELFEHRWRKAYEVRALERESRQGRSQVRAHMLGRSGWLFAACLNARRVYMPLMPSVHG